MRIDDFNRMAEAANDIRLDTEFMRLSRGAENQLEGDVEKAKEIKRKIAVMFSIIETRFCFICIHM